MEKKNCAIIIVSTLCFLGVARLVQCSKDPFELSGRVICDNCRIGWPTLISPNIPSADVELTCFDRTQKNPVFTVKTNTNHEGEYTFFVPPQHKGTTCVPHVVSSPDANCNEQTLLSTGAGIKLDEIKTGSNKIHINSLLLSAKEAVDECIPVLHNMGFDINIKVEGDIEL